MGKELELALKQDLDLKQKPKYRKLSLKSREQFSNEIVNEEKNINEEIFRNYFKYQDPSFLVKDLFEKDKNKNN